MNHGSKEYSLKYLGFIPAALASFCLYLSTIYEAAKDQAGPLRPGVDDVEDMLKTVLRPVVRIAEDQSAKLLDHVDKKVDEKLKLVDEHIPAFIRPFAFHAQRTILHGELAGALNMKSSGFHESASRHVHVYDRGAQTDDWSYEFVRKSVAFLNLIGAVRMLGPGAVYSAELFNQVVGALREVQIPFSSYIPDVPVQVIENALKMSYDAAWQPWQLNECEGAC